MRQRWMRARKACRFPPSQDHLLYLVVV